MAILRDTIKAIWPEAEVFDFESETDTLYLWQNPVAIVGDVVITWSDTFQDEKMGAINSSDFLGPLEWAAVRVLEWDKHHLGVNPPKDRVPRTMIVDLNPRGHAEMPLTGLYRATKPECLPWIRVVSMHDLLSVVRLDSNAASQLDLSSFFASGSVSANNVLATAWMRHLRLLMTEQGEKSTISRHAVVNAVGPLMLLGAGLENRSPHQIALCSLIHAMGLQLPEVVPPPPASDDGEWTWILMDDQAEHGWKQWFVLQAVGHGACPAAIWSQPAEFTALLNRLDLQLAASRQQEGTSARDCRFCARLAPEDGEPGPEVLFLDLRLFEVAGAQEGTEFFAKLISLCRKYFQDTEGSRLAYPGFSDDELARIEKDQGKTSPEALTLLPRFLALADMSLPIVLFSSTLQRSVLAKLVPYGNIFTGLNKNVLGSGMNLSPGEYVGKIVPLLRAILRWRAKLVELKIAFPPPCLKDSLKHWEFYADESRNLNDGDLHLAGLWVGYGSREMARAVHNDMTAEGIHWGPSLDPSKPSLRKEENPVAALAQWQRINPVLKGILASTQVLSFVVRLARPTPSGIGFLAEKSLDNYYLRSLEQLVEAMLMESPWSPGALPESLIIFPAQREKDIEKFADDESALECVEANWKWYAAFGLSLTPRRKSARNPAKVTFQSLSGSDFLPNLLAIIERRQQGIVTESLANAVIGCYFVPLNDERLMRTLSGCPRLSGDPRTWTMAPELDTTFQVQFGPYRHLHFAVDLLARLARSRQGPQSWFSGWTNTETAFDGAVGDLSALLQIARSLDEGSFKPAVCASAFMESGRSCHDFIALGCVGQSLMYRLRVMIETHLSGADFQRLVASPERSP